MQDFRAEISKFRGFAIGNDRNGAGLWHQARVGRQHTVHIRPANHFLSVQGRAENRRGIVGAAAT